VNEFLDYSRDKIVDVDNFKLIGTKSIGSAVHVLMRFHLYDMLMHSVGMPANEERPMVGPSLLGKVPPNLQQVRELSYPGSLLLTTCVDLCERLGRLDILCPQLQEDYSEAFWISGTSCILLRIRNTKSINYADGRTTAARA
jgi:hypothetical protein